jgi:hypothetical protein
VLSSTRNPVFAKQKMSPSRSRGLALPYVLLAFLSACLSGSLHADSLEDAARALAAKVCAAPHQQSVKLDWQMPPELPAPSSDLVKNAFFSQLSGCRMVTGETPGLPLLTIAIRLTASKALLVASFENSKEGPLVRMTEIQREDFSISHDASRTPRLQSELLWQQERPLDSAMEWYDPSTQQHFLFLLSQGSFVRLRSTNEVWAELDSAELPVAAPRSRLGSGGGTFLYFSAETKLRILINRKLCAFEPAGSLSFKCTDTDLGGKVLRISAECGNTPWWLWTDSGDYTQRDRIICGKTQVTAAELLANEATSHSLEMPGPVLDVSTTLDSKAAIAVVRNLSMGNYEVYRVTLACAH